MNNEQIENTVPPEAVPSRDNSMKWLAGSIVLSALIISLNWAYVQTKDTATADPQVSARNEIAKLTAEIVPTAGITLPVRWAGVAKAAVDSGALNKEAFEAVYAERGGVPTDIADALDGKDAKIKITGENSGALLNVLWAVGLAQNGSVLKQGPMRDPQYGGAKNFASTGGWTLAKGDAMSHYAMHDLMSLDQEAQEKVERVAGGIYRPCCGNATHFPDCNHGMAMLGLLEMMASQGVSEKEMYDAALALNRFWFPDTYVNAAKYAASQGTSWDKMQPQELLSAQFSSSRGAADIKSKLSPSPAVQGGGGCGV